VRGDAVRPLRAGERRRRVLLALLFAGAFALGAYAPLWDAMPWAVTR
jgi:hypothetical protein